MKTDFFNLFITVRFDLQLEQKKKRMDGKYDFFPTHR